VSSCRYGEAAKVIHVRTRCSLRLQRAPNPGCGEEAIRSKSASTEACDCVGETDWLVLLAGSAPWSTQAVGAVGGRYASADAVCRQRLGAAACTAKSLS
jgi:hypothetical protein